MRSRYLLSQRQSDAAALRLGRVERHEEILRIGDSHSTVFYPHHKVRLSNAPANAYRLGAVGHRGIYSIREQIDEHLFQLIGIGVKHDGWYGIHLNGHPLLE